MALQFSVTDRNTMLNAFTAGMGGSQIIEIWTGSVPLNAAAANTGTLLVTFSLAGSNDWAAASLGAATLNNLPITATPVNNGVAGYFRHYDASLNCRMQGTVTASGGGGDVTLVNTTIATGVPVTLQTYTLTAPGA